jgi:hypothetical protein
MRAGKFNTASIRGSTGAVDAQRYYRVASRRFSGGPNAIVHDNDGARCVALRQAVTTQNAGDKVAEGVISPTSASAAAGRY